MKFVNVTIASAALIALNFAGTEAYAQGATAIYGSTRISFNSQRVGSGDDVRQVTDNASRLGFRGSEVIATGLDAVYGYELSVTADNIGAGTPTALIGVRNAYVGMRGAFGTFAIGALDSGNPTGSPLYSQVTSIVSFAPGDAGATAIGTSILNSRNRTPNSIGYQSPRMGDFVGRARYYYRGAGSATQKESDLRSMDLGLAYNAGNLIAGVGYARDSRGGGLIANELEDKWQIGARYSFGVVQPYFLVGVDHYVATAKTREDVKWWLVGANVPFGANAVVLNLMQRDVQSALVGERKRVQLAFIHKMSRRMELHAFIDRDGIDSEKSGVAVRTIGLGMRHDF